MPTLFHTTFEERCQPAAERAFGVTVTIRKGVEETAPFTAVFDDEEYSSFELKTGLPIKIQYRVWYVPAEACLINSIEFNPAAGQRIVEGGEEYEILPLAGRPAAELQPGEWRWRIHTKRVTA